MATAINRRTLHVSSFASMEEKVEYKTWSVPVSVENMNLLRDMESKEVKFKDEFEKELRSNFPFITGLAWHFMDP